MIFRASAPLLLLLACVYSAKACTQILLPAPGGDVVIANTIEAGDFVEQHGGHFVHTFLRGDVAGGGRAKGCGGDCIREAVVESGNSTNHCATFRAKYGYVGGMNEKGLVVQHHSLFLTQYEEIIPGEFGICARDFDQWALSSFASVAEVTAALDSEVRPRIIADPLDVPDRRQFMWGVVDATGAAIVVEFVKGLVHIHNNTAIGLLTNDPTWEWHVANVNNYVAMTPGWYQNSNAGMQIPVADKWYPWTTNAFSPGPPVVPSPIAHAQNMLGLPGDGSPASRFVRGFFLRAYALHGNPPDNLEDVLILGQELLNAVYKVKGTIPGKDSDDPIETTPIATLSIPATMATCRNW